VLSLWLKQVSDQSVLPQSTNLRIDTCSPGWAVKADAIRIVEAHGSFSAETAFTIPAADTSIGPEG